MQKLAAYYLILLYACSIAKPVAVWFADVMAHSYFSQRHASVVHRDGGKEHVHYQMSKAANDDAPEQKSATPKNSEDVTVASFIESFPRLASPVNTKHNTPKVDLLPSVFLSVQIPPPWWVAASFYFG